MAVSRIKAIFQEDIKKVWETVTSLEDYEWRSDLDKIEVMSREQFIEYTKEGYATTFTVTVMKEYERWEFDMENANMRGHWSGAFTSRGEQTEIEFTEDVSAKKLVMKPFIKAFLKKQQRQYITDLRKALSE